MEKYEVELRYAWVETDDGICHAFEIVDADDECGGDVVERLAECLDTTPEDNRFNWDSVVVNIPEGIVKRIAGTLSANDIS